MTTDLLALSLEVAAIVEAAGAMALRGFARPFAVEGKGLHGDVVTNIDIEIERFLKDALLRRFPNDGVLVEEEESIGGQSGYRWAIDPLDGTNNFVLGIPVFGVALARLGRSGGDIGIINLPVIGQTTIAVRGVGLIGVKDRDPVSVESGLTVSIVQGYDIPHNADVVKRVKAAFDPITRRYLSTWAPTTDFTLVAGGKVDAVVGIRTRGIELAAGEIVMREAGLAVEAIGVADGGNPLSASDAWIAADPVLLPGVLERFREAI